MPPIRFIAVAAPALLALAACEDEADVPADDEDGREASGEVLEGTISDEMLPLDEVRSQAPLAQPDDAEEASGEDAAE